MNCLAPTARVFAATLFAALPTAAAAQELQIEFDRAAAQDAGVDPDEAEAQLRASADTTLKVADQQAFLEQMAHATALSTRGMGVDYASNPQKFVFGMSFGSAVSGAGAQFARGGVDLPEGGFAGGLSAMAGINLGVGAEEDSFARRLRLYANGFYARPSYAPFRGTVVNFGGHLQVQLLRHRDGDATAHGPLAYLSSRNTAQVRMHPRRQGDDYLERAVPGSGRRHRPAT